MYIIQTYIHTSVLTYLRTYKHMCTYIHTYIHGYAEHNVQSLKVVKFTSYRGIKKTISTANICIPAQIHKTLEPEPICQSFSLPQHNYSILNNALLMDIENLFGGIPALWEQTETSQVEHAAGCRH